MDQVDQRPTLVWSQVVRPLIIQITWWRLELFPPTRTHIHRVFSIALLQKLFVVNVNKVALYFHSLVFILQGVVKKGGMLLK